jgi:hypothetical protein
MRYWDADPILETQDRMPRLERVGPVIPDGERLLVPVIYQPMTQYDNDAGPVSEPEGRPFTKTFMFVRQGQACRVEDITTWGITEETVSMKATLQDSFGR